MPHPNPRIRAQQAMAKQRALSRRPSLRKMLTAPKILRRVVNREIARKEETKYHAEQLLMKGALDWGIHTPWTPSTIGDTLPLVPRILPGDGSFQRVGAKVRPTSCRVDVEVAIQEAPVGLPALNSASEDIYVVMYLLRPKTSKNFYQFTNPAPAASAYTDELLDNGDGTAKPFGFGTVISGTTFIYSNAADLQLPVNKEYFTLVKRKIVRLTKNAGSTNGDGANYPSVSKGSSTWRGSFKYKLPTLRYDDDPKTSTVNGQYPTNANMVMCIGACLANGTDSLQYVGSEASSVLPNPILCSVRTHYWYKDA